MKIEKFEDEQFDGNIERKSIEKESYLLFKYVFFD